MLKNMLLGQYLPGNSPVHRINPALKIIFTIVYMIVIFAVSSPLQYALIIVFTAAILIISKIPLEAAIKGLKPLRWILAFSVVINLFSVKGDVLFSLGFLGLSVSREGLYAAAAVFLRLILLVTGTSVLTLTTMPLSLTDGIETLLKPFERIKLPAAEIAMMMSIAIRFIPVLSEEADKIMQAQTARGADFSSGGIIRRARAVIPILVPLFVSAFRRADELASAMTARCYGAGKRTKMKENALASTDIWAAAVFAAAAVILMLLR